MNGAFGFCVSDVIDGLRHSYMVYRARRGGVDVGW